MHPEFWRVLYRLFRYPIAALIGGLTMTVCAVGILIFLTALETGHRHGGGDLPIFLGLHIGCSALGQAILLAVVERLRDEPDDRLYRRRSLLWISTAFALAGVVVFCLAILFLTPSGGAGPFASVHVLEVLKRLLDESGRFVLITSILLLIPGALSLALIANVRRHEPHPRRRIVFSVGALTLLLTVWWLVGPPVWYDASLVHESFVRALYFGNLALALTCPLVLAATRRLDHRVDAALTSS